MTEPVLVTGATGNVGRHVVADLHDAGVPVRALTRHPDTARLPAGVEVVGGDLTAPDTLGPALAGVGAVFLLWPYVTDDRVADVVAVVTARARRVVYLSAMNPRGVFETVEGLLARSGVEWTFLRAGGFATNTLGWADQIRAGGVVRWPYADAARSLVHERDLAAVAVRTLLEPGHGGGRYVLTGPAAITQADQVRAIGAAIGRPLRYQEISRDAGRARLLAQGFPAAFADHALDYWASLVDTPEPVTDEVARLTGKPARSFPEWATDHAADFR
jgi:uncharacterized protein YbjT (DUF2867 family)